MKNESTSDLRLVILGVKPSGIVFILISTHCLFKYGRSALVKWKDNSLNEVPSDHQEERFGCLFMLSSRSGRFWWWWWCVFRYQVVGYWYCTVRSVGRWLAITVQVPTVRMFWFGPLIFWRSHKRAGKERWWFFELDESAVQYSFHTIPCLLLTPYFIILLLYFL